MAFFFPDRRPLEIPPPSSFQRTMRYSITSKSIHEPTGRAIVLGKDIFYSPNSSIIPLRPPPPTDTYVRDPLKDSVEEFHQPHWWNMNAGYLPFLPTFPNFHSPPFHTLFNNPIEIGPHRKRRIQMDSVDILNWNRLEHMLTQLFKSFQSVYSIPDMPPIIRTSLVCQSSFEYPSQFIAAEKRCRNWFSVWMGMISLCIAVAEIADEDGSSDDLPRWYKMFAQHTAEDILCGIRQQLGQFNPFTARAGVFLNLISSQEQPSVDFFVRLGIPVWYPWGAAEESRARQNPQYYGKYIPPAHLLQASRSYLTVPISAASSEEVRPWLEFFAARERRATGPMPAKKPPRKVFHWEKDCDGQWQRIQVLRRLQVETLAEYGKRQKNYDERTNEWDCCTEMGDMDASERQALDWELDDELLLPVGWNPCLSEGPSSMGAPSNLDVPLESSEPRARNINISNSPVSSGVAVVVEADYALSGIPSESLASSRPTAAPQNINYIPDEHSPADLLRLYFGFVAPPPFVRLRVMPPTEQQVKDLGLGTGYTSESMDMLKEYVNTAVGKAAANFFWSMSQTPWVPPHNMLFDLATGNPQSLKFRRRLKFMRELPGNTFLFDFKGESTVDWKVAVCDITDALFIVRLDDELSDYDIAWELVHRGMPFHTLLHTRRFIVEPLPRVCHRMRLSDYSFGPTDYVSYCRAKDELLRNPRVARQALKHGGIIWRLAMGNTSMQDVLSGPTTVATLRHHCISFSTDLDMFWVDDVLEPNEMDLLCGVYHVYTGQGSQVAKKSWWPPMDLWNIIVRQSFWHERSETFYDNRLQELESGKGVPLTSTQWRSRIKSNSVVRRATINNMTVSTNFLKDIIH